MNGTTDLFDLSGRRAIVTGAAGLLGRVFCQALLDAGATVALMDLDRDGVERRIAGFEKSGQARAVPLVCDITDEAQVGDCIEQFTGGGIDILVNSAAVDPKFEPDESGQLRNASTFTGYAVDHWRRSLEVNLTGTFLITRGVCAVMERRAKGAIVNISSHYGLAGPDQRIYRHADGSQPFFKPVDYSVTKAGILGFTRALAAFYRGTQIRVNALTPGGAYNDHDPEFVANYSARTILGRMAQPDEYRGAILFLCSDASSYMTGANLIVDGGWTAL